MMKMRIDAIFDISNIRILLYLLENEKARYSDLLKYVIPVRSTLALALRELKKDNLIERNVEATTPVKTWYSLTDLGKEAAMHLQSLKNLIKS